MNPKKCVVVGSMLGVCLSPLAAATAAAGLPAESSAPAVVVPHDPPVRDHNYPADDPLYEAAAVNASTAANSSDDNATAALQIGVVLGAAGAGLTLGAVQLYHRRQKRAT
ncbi:hypothetical protein ACGFIF_37400 [Kribbella sp. NPDC049174]|uniref:hypothetical protein n=1 Tax=Kribbella sp. NPDC049174 TaxID=3364112 RepID=UPI00371F3EC3